MSARVTFAIADRELFVVVPEMMQIRPLPCPTPCLKNNVDCRTIALWRRHRSKIVADLAAGEAANCGAAMLMLRKFWFAIAVAASLSLPAIAFAASVHGKRQIIHHWHGYGFLPGYHQPPNNSVPMYRSKARQTLRQATGMAADGTISANRTFSTAVGMAAVSGRAGLIRLSG